MKNMISKHNLYLLPLLYMAGLFCVNTLAPDSNERIAGIYLSRYLQDSLHIPIYTGLFMLWVIAFANRGLLSGAAVRLAVAITVGYGIFEEISQVFIPGRFGSVGDVLLDAIGCFLGLIVYKRFKTFKSEQVAAG